MTTPATTISASNIQTEHGGSNPISLSEYGRSPYGLTAMVNNNVPFLVGVGSPISYSQLRSTSRLPWTTNIQVTAATASVDLAAVSFRYPYVYSGGYRFDGVGLDARRYPMYVRYDIVNNTKNVINITDSSVPDPRDPYGNMTYQITDVSADVFTPDNVAIAGNYYKSGDAQNFTNAFIGMQEGTYVWRKTITASSGEISKSPAARCAKYGNYVAAIVATNSPGTVVMLFNNQGTLLWQKVLEPETAAKTTKFCQANALHMDGTGIYVTGQVRRKDLSQPAAMFAMRLSFAGDILWQTRSTETNDVGVGISICTDYQGSAIDLYTYVSVYILTNKNVLLKMGLPGGSLWSIKATNFTQMSSNVGTVVYNRDTSQITVAMNGTPSTTHGVLIATVNHLGTVLSQQYVETFTGSPPAGYGYVPPNPVLADVAANTVYLGGSYVIGANTGTQRVPLIYSMVATATLPPSGSRVDVMNAYLDGGAVANTHTQTVSTLSSVTWSSFSVPFESLSGGATTPTTPLTVTTPAIYDYNVYPGHWKTVQY